MEKKQAGKDLQGQTEEESAGWRVNQVHLVSRQPLSVPLWTLGGLACCRKMLKFQQGGGGGRRRQDKQVNRKLSWSKNDKSDTHYKIIWLIFPITVSTDPTVQRAEDPVGDRNRERVALCCSSGCTPHTKTTLKHLSCEICQHLCSSVSSLIFS